MMRKRISSLAVVLLALTVPVLALACNAKKVDFPAQPDLPGVNLPVFAQFACFVFNDQPGVISFEDRSTGAPTSWSWDFGDGRTATEQHPKHQYAVAGRYFVSLTVRDGRTSDTTGQFAITGAGCTTAFCGDGTVDPGEQCDDGNNIPGDGCNEVCVAEFCGDGIVNNGEECDDGNAVHDDACGNDCTLPE